MASAVVIPATSAPRTKVAYVVAVLVVYVALFYVNASAPFQTWLVSPTVEYVVIAAVTAYVAGKVVRYVVVARVVVPQTLQPRNRLTGGISYVMETVAGFIIGILVVGIVLGVFILLSNMRFNVNGTTFFLIPQQIAGLTQSTTMTLISIIVIVAIVVILIPVVKYLMDLFTRGR